LIELFNLPVGKLLLQAGLNLGCECEEQQARGIQIEAVDGPSRPRQTGRHMILMPQSSSCHAEDTGRLLNNQ
jgi:hypothetical protein